ncbi:MAG: DNA polymerase III subunit beta [Verrucomicrobia bacterium]|nr:DNA polymerase III subunit beta [Verrucomicrobiota bacterium]
MKLSIARDQLAAGLQAVQTVIGGRSTLPILSNVLLRAANGALELTGTDLDVSIRTRVAASVEEGGSITLPAKTLASIVRELSHPEIELSLEAQTTCGIRCGPSQFRLRGLPAEEFPSVDLPETPRLARLPQNELRKMLRQTAFAASTDDARYVLNGLFWAAKEHRLTLVATDGKRLALTYRDTELEPGVEREFVLPIKAVTELGRLLKDQGEVEISVSENQAAVRILSDKDDGETLLLTKLLEGAYPDYRQVIPQQCKKQVTVIREELLQALRRAEIVTTERANSVKLNFSRNELCITANSPDIGEAQEVLTVKYDGEEEFAIAFNPVYLVEALRALEEEEVRLELNDHLSPGILRTEGSFLYVIMPMRM